MANKFLVLVCFFLPLLGTEGIRFYCSRNKQCAENKNGNGNAYCKYNDEEGLGTCTRPPPPSPDRTQNPACKSLEECQEFDTTYKSCVIDYFIIIIN